MANWYLGTMGFSYQDWVGVFYPQAMKVRGFLSHYSRFFNAVEIDSTFYGTPRAATVKRWAAVTPAEYRICVKTPRLITHDKSLIDTHREMGQFIEVMRGLGPKLGVILIQFPPSFGFDQQPALAEFLGDLPVSLKYAVEFRHQSWYRVETAELLREHQVCWAGTEYPGLPRGVTKTADFLYIRWVGQHGRLEKFDREQIDVTANMKHWLENLEPLAGGEVEIYGFFNNDYSGFAAGTCNRFKGMLGIPTSNLKPPQQGRLF